MRFVMSVILILCLLSVSILAQDDASCSAYIQEVMPRIADNCGGMGVNEACYGNNRVDATFWEEQPEAMFSQPSDRVSLTDVQSIATAPLSLEDELWGVAILNVQTNLGYTLPGQAVRFLLMGDARIENDVSPNDLLIGGEPIIGIVNSGANVRSQPSTTANIIGGFAAGDEVQVVGTIEAGDWFEVLVDGRGTGWVWSELIGMGETGTLPITYREGQSLYAPMQAFYFTAGIGELQCNEAPNAMIVQNPNDEDIIIRINDLQVTFGSTAIFMKTETDDVPVLIVSLLEGNLKATSVSASFTLDQPGETTGVTLNTDGRVDANSNTVDVLSNTLIDRVLGACSTAEISTSIEGDVLQNCSFSVNPLSSASTSLPTQSTTAPSNTTAPSTNTQQTTTIAPLWGTNACSPAQGTSKVIFRTGSCGRATEQEALDASPDTSVTIDGSQYVALSNKNGVSYGGSCGWSISWSSPVVTLTPGTHTLLFEVNKPGVYDSNTCVYLVQ